jgi:transposase
VRLRCEGTKLFKRAQLANMTAADPFADVNATSKRLDAIPGVGPALATALVASIADPGAFRSGRDFSAWVELVPKQNSSGGKDKLGSISKQGDRYLRSLFTAGALAVIRYAKIHGTQHRPWLTALLARRPTKVAAIALANGDHDDPAF